MAEFTDNDYKPDFEISDKYIDFSSELLRLSLLAITGLGSLVLFSIQNESLLQLNITDKCFLFATILFFALAAGTSLVHRFWATDSLSYHIAYLRKKTETEKEGRKNCLKKAELFLILTEWIFGIAVAPFVITILQFLVLH